MSQNHTKQATFRPILGMLDVLLLVLGANCAQRRNSIFKFFSGENTKLYEFRYMWLEALCPSVCSDNMR